MRDATTRLELSGQDCRRRRSKQDKSVPDHHLSLGCSQTRLGVCHIVAGFEPSLEGTAPSFIMSVTYENVSSLWKTMKESYGMAAMVDKSEMGHECLRETLSQLKGVWSDSQEHSRLISEAIQILTVLKVMTGFAQMDGEGGVKKYRVWVEAQKLDVHPPMPMRQKLAGFISNESKFQHMKEIIGQSRIEIKMLLEDTQVSSSHMTFKKVDVLLDDLQIMLRACFVNRVME